MVLDGNTASDFADYSNRLFFTLQGGWAPSALLRCTDKLSKHSSSQRVSWFPSRNSTATVYYPRSGKLIPLTAPSVTRRRVQFQPAAATQSISLSSPA